MSNFERQVVGMSILFVIIVSAIAFVTGINIGTVAGYKDGQTDALNGKWKYELKTDTVMVNSVVEVGQ
jgi:ABC-type microcin C transport system permease subunit YejE